MTRTSPALFLTLLSGLAAAACAGARNHAAQASPAPALAALEARTASIYAGACHYNGERMLDGRTAVLFWRTSEGATLAACVHSEQNLDDHGPRRSVVYLDETATKDQERSAREWIELRGAPLLGTVVAFEREPIGLVVDAERFAARVGTRIELVGAALPNRECCKMPYNVWYEPLLELGTEQRRVGCSESFRCFEPRLGLEFERRGENDAWFGALASTQQVPERD
jgi:hypothetical protein